MTLELGILGCARIARQFAHQVAGSTEVRVAAVASRTPGKAQAFAAELGIARAHGSYQALLADPGVQAVYIPLPNSLHAPWAIAAARAGKHVLCEKPLACSLAEAQAMFGAADANGVMLLEAYPWWFQPQTARLVALLAEGAIGRVQSVQASIGFTIASAEDIRMDPALGGGALLDAGTYPVSLVRLVMGEAPVQAQAHARWSQGGPAHGVDLATHGSLFFADGRIAQIGCAMDSAANRHALIVGNQGVISTEYLNHTAVGPGLDALGALPGQMRLRRCVGSHVPFEDVSAPSGPGFRFAAEALARVVREADHAAIARAAEASLDIAATLEALAQSARRQGERVSLTAR